MTKNGKRTFNFYAVLFMTVLLLILSCVMSLSACKDDNDADNESKTTITYPSASKTEDDNDDVVKFGSFEGGNYNLSSTSFPSSSVNGWSSIGKDSKAPSSDYSYINKSGLIDKASWDKTVAEFAKDIEDIGDKLPKNTIFGENNGDRVLMLNAYSKKNIVTASKATQSSSVTLDKGGVYKIMVDVLTANLSALHQDEGANIQLINTVNGQTQAVVGINGITNDTWTTYTFYVKADKYLSCTVKLVLGLGRAGSSDKVTEHCVSGSAFFDNVKIEKIEEGIPATFDTSVVYGGETEIWKQTPSVNYSMEVNKYTHANNVITPSTSMPMFTVAKNGYSTARFTVNVKAPVGKTQDDFKSFKIFVDEYANDTDTTPVKKNEVKSFDYSEDEQVFYLVVKNNYNLATTPDQFFKIRTEIDADYTFDYTIDYNDPTTIDKEDIDYKLFTSTAGKTISLYNGYVADYVDTEATKETYTFNPATTEEDPNSVTPVIVKDYKGIPYNSSYLAKEYDATRPATINKKIADGKAGLKRLPATDQYKTTNEFIQPIYIENNNEASYGFIGGTNKISASSYATVSLKVKVEGLAKAYIYLVDTETLEVIKWQDNDLFVVVDKDSQTNQDLNGWTIVNFYIATGKTEKSFRVEMWNGERGSDALSTGTVFFDDIKISTSASNFESERWEDLEKTGTLGKLTAELSQKFDSKVIDTRALSEKEIAFNEEYPDMKVEYRRNYVFAKSDLSVYAVYNTIDPVDKDPYANAPKDEEAEASCQADPSTFWFSFSSIVLVAGIIIALIALIVKNTLIRNKKNKSDAKSHYKVQSKHSAKKKAEKEVIEEPVEEAQEATEAVEEESSETVEEATQDEDAPTEEVKEDETLDEYVYGDVQDFGEKLETNEDKTEAEDNEPSEKPEN